MSTPMSEHFRGTGIGIPANGARENNRRRIASTMMMEPDDYALGVSRVEMAGPP